MGAAVKLRDAVVASLVAALLFGGVNASASAGAGGNPCKGNDPPAECGILETPWTLILPAAGVALAVSYYLIQRRLSGREASGDVA